jgi:MYXO-CTERM domain-containing protein
MLRHWHRAFTILLFLVVAACSGGGCSSGCSCAGITPIGRAFPANDQVPNAAAARVTRDGLDFIQTNAPTLAGTLLKSGGGGVEQIDIPDTPESVAGFSVTICPNGSSAGSSTSPEICELDANIAGSTFYVDSVTPDDVVVSGILMVRAEDINVSTPLGNIYIGIGSSLNCDGNTPSSNGSSFSPVGYVGLNFTITLPLVADTIAPRVGYTKIDGPNIGVSVDTSALSSAIEFCTSCGSICNDILDGLKDVAFDVLSSTITGYLKTAVQNELCTKASTTTTPACPYGSVDVSGTCMYGPSNSACLPIELGTDGHIDLSTALQSISPGTMGGLDFLFAAGGNMIPAPSDPIVATSSDPNATDNGITLGFLGGALPGPQSQCVPPFNNVVPLDIPIPAALEGSHGTDDFGIAIAQRFLNYAFGSVYNSGLLCLGVSTASEQELASGLLSLLIPGIKDLVFQWGNPSPAAAAIITRPQFPPVVTVGDGTSIKTDPLLSIFIKQFAIDFYIFSEDRFVRAFTFTSDLTVPVDLQSSAAGLLPVIGSIGVANPEVTNSALLLDKPTAIAGALGSIIGTAASELTGGLKAINVSSALASYGLSLDIDTIGKTTQGTDNYLTIWATLATGGAMPIKPVHVGLKKKTVDPSAMSLTTYDRAKLPSLALHLETDEVPGGAAVEYSYWIDSSTHSAWSTEIEPVVQNDILFFQGNHTLHVTGRLVGHPESEAQAPSDLPFTIDVLPPNIDLQLNEAATGVTLAAYDFVTPRSDLVARYQTVGWNGVAGGWTDWAPLTSLATFSPGMDSSAVTVEVKDTEGNVGQQTIELIRGRPNPGAVASSCSCRVPGGTTPGSTSGVGTTFAWAMGLGLLLVAAAVRRRSARSLGKDGRFAAAVGLAAVTVGGALSEGCSCGAAQTTGDGQHDAGDESAADATGKPLCGPTCNQACLPSLPPGLVGAYTSTAKTKSGTIWVAGYNDSAVTSDFSGLYGDLVVGQFDSAKNGVEWVTVDGVPALPKGTCAVYDPTGWRSGISSAGEDVGLWTSLQIDANDHPIVSYYDATNKALKFASSTDGKKWNITTVMQTVGSDIGRYSKMLVISGIPTIAFLIMEPGTGGKLRSKVEVATATSATPTTAADWQFEDAAVDENGPCRASFCTGSAVCIASTGSCETPVTTCKSSCDGGVCVSTEAGPSCETPLSASYIDIYPNAFGDYITMANGPSGLGIAVYDRIDGLLEGVSKVAGSWQSQVIDGWTQPRMPSTGPDGGTSSDDEGDVGVGASLFIAENGDWHISYVNGTTEALQYILVPGGGNPTKYPEIVDNGLSLDGTLFADGLHIVGDDSFIMVDTSGVVTIRYQDATAGTLRYATGTPQPGGTHQWAFHAVSQPGLFAGFFPHQLAGQDQVANWWRKADPATGNISGNVSFVSP